MTADRATRPDAWLGCVVAGETGVCRVLTDRGEIRASFGSRLLGEIARDRTCVPVAGDWVVLCEWPDHRVTIEERVAARGLAPVIPLRGR